MADLNDDIRSRGHWLVVIRPTAFVAGRVSDIAALFPIVEFEVDVSRTELEADPRGLALRGSIEVFKRFGWDPPLENLRAWQAEIGRG